MKLSILILATFLYGCQMTADQVEHASNACESQHLVPSLVNNPDGSVREVDCE